MLIVNTIFLLYLLNKNVYLPKTDFSFNYHQMWLADEKNRGTDMNISTYQFDVIFQAVYVYILTANPEINEIYMFNLYPQRYISVKIKVLIVALLK